MSKFYHLHLYPFDRKGLLTTYDEVEQAVQNGVEFIDTSQIVTCTTDLFRKGYRIFVHPNPFDGYEIKLGKNDRTSREIKMGHCLYKLILAGEFDVKGDEPI